mmetsp:Transcript_6641/g.11595  ORF Transcript_6641/g.11595 Transcript_6641/m.11595 type:complete len:232 (-) Transcript_6641:447-1142(-)
MSLEKRGINSGCKYGDLALDALYRGPPTVKGKGCRMKMLNHTGDSSPTETRIKMTMTTTTTMITTTVRPLQQQQQQQQAAAMICSQPSKIQTRLSTMTRGSKSRALSLLVLVWNHNRYLNSLCEKFKKTRKLTKRRTRRTTTTKMRKRRRRTTTTTKMSNLSRRISKKRNIKWKVGPRSLQRKRTKPRHLVMIESPKTKVNFLTWTDMARTLRHSPSGWTNCLRNTTIAMR